MRNRRGSAFGYFLAALLGALVGGLLVVAVIEKGRVSTPAASEVPSPLAGGASRAVSAPGSQGSVTEAVRRVGPAVVSIDTRIVKQVPSLFGPFFGDEAEPMPGEGKGSGMIIDARRGYVLTNAHVVKDAREITVKLLDKRSFKGKVIGQDSQSDLAVVRITTNGLPEVTLSRGAPPQIGSWVLAIGNPFGLENTVTVGVVSATERDIASPEPGAPELQRLIQTDAAINPGNSGGPLCNLNGEVIGVNTVILASGQGIGFAISSAHAWEVAQQLIEQGKVIRPWIGIQYTLATPEMREYFGLPTTEGAIIADVMPDSPAARAGLQRGDLIVEIDHVPIKGRNELRTEILKRKVGQTVNLLIYRGKESRVIKLQTAEMPQNLRQR